MAKHRYPDHALKAVLDADAALTADDLTKLSGVEASAAELNYVDGLSAAGSATASKVVLLDANSALSGLRFKVLNDADGAAGLDAAYSGYVITNLGATGAATFVLAAAAVGVHLWFYVLAAQELRIDPNGTETIGLPSSGAQQAAGKFISADAVGEYAHVACVKAGQWEVLDYRGTWTVEG